MHTGCSRKATVSSRASVMSTTESRHHSPQRRATSGMKSWTHSHLWKSAILISRTSLACQVAVNPNSTCFLPWIIDPTVQD